MTILKLFLLNSLVYTINIYIPKHINLKNSLYTVCPSMYHAATVLFLQVKCTNMYIHIISKVGNHCTKPTHVHAYRQVAGWPTAKQHD